MQLGVDGVFDDASAIKDRFRRSWSRCFRNFFPSNFPEFSAGVYMTWRKIHGESKISKRWKAFWKLGTWQFLEVYYILLPHRRLAVASSSLRIRQSEHVPLSRTKDAQLRMLEDAPNSTAQFGDLYRFVTDIVTDIVTFEYIWQILTALRDEGQMIFRITMWLATFDAGRDSLQGSAGLPVVGV